MSASITAVEGDTQLRLTLVLTDAYRAINLQAASSITMTMDGSTTTLTALPIPGACTFTVPSTFLDTIGHFNAEIIVTIDGNDQYFPSESPIFVEILPHTRSRS